MQRPVNSDLAVDATALFRARPTGVDRAARSWVTAVAQARPEWSIVLAGWRGVSDTARPLPMTRPPALRSAPLPRYGYRLAELVRLPTPIDRLVRVDAERWLFPNFVALPLAQPRPSVTMVHDLSFLIPERFSHRMHRAFLRRQVASALQRTTVAVVSASVADEVARAYSVARDRVHVVPHGVDHERFRPVAPGQIAVTRERLALDRPYVVAVGALHARKNLERLIAAFVSLGPVVEGVDLVLAGPTNAHSAAVLDVVRTYAGPGRVRHLGFVAEADLPALYAGALVAAVPSLYEGFGLPVLEAMACGAPVLTATRGALAEVGGDAVERVDVRDTAALARGLRRLLSHPGLREERAAAGLARAAGFTWTRAGALLAELLETAV